jgi:hypothetical protein
VLTSHICADTIEILSSDDEIPATPTHHKDRSAVSLRAQQLSKIKIASNAADDVISLSDDSDQQSLPARRLNKHMDGSVDVAVGKRKRIDDVDQRYSDRDTSLTKAKRFKDDSAKSPDSSAYEPLFLPSPTSTSPSSAYLLPPIILDTPQRKSAEVAASHGLAARLDHVEPIHHTSSHIPHIDFRTYNRSTPSRKKAVSSKAAGSVEGIRTVIDRKDLESPLRVEKTLKHYPTPPVLGSVTETKTDDSRPGLVKSQMASENRSISAQRDIHPLALPSVTQRIFENFDRLKQRRNARQSSKDYREIHHPQAVPSAFTSFTSGSLTIHKSPSLTQQEDCQDRVTVNAIPPARPMNRGCDAAARAESPTEKPIDVVQDLKPILNEDVDMDESDSDMELLYPE